MELEDDMTKVYDPIQTITVSDNSTSVVNFTSIPQTFTDLRLVCSFSYFNTGLGGGNNFIFRFNSDATASRYREAGIRIFSTTSNPITGYIDSGSSGYLRSNMSISSDRHAIVIIDISGYTNSYSKGISVMGTGFSGTGVAGQTSASAAHTNASYFYGGSATPAITSINLLFNSPYNFQATSYFTLYGI